MGAIFNRGGVIPEKYGLSLTVYSKVDVKSGQPLVFDKTAGDYGVNLAGAGKVPQAIVKVGGKAGEPISCYVIGKSRNVKVATKEVVAVGDTVVADADGLFAKEVVAAEKEPIGLLVVKGFENKTAEVLI